MPRYSDERKQAILQKMAPPRSMTVAELSAAEGISDATLYNWRKAAREQGAILPSDSAPPDNWTSEDKFRAVIQTASMTQAEVSEYCRERGLYPEQLERWKAACVAGNDMATRQTKEAQQAARTRKRRIKTLESELRRKDKALAETAALLTLSKKPRRSGATATRTHDQPPGSPTRREAHRRRSMPRRAAGQSVRVVAHQHPHLSAMDTE